MPILKKSEGSFTLIEPGTHPARCYGMVSLGTQPANNPKFKSSFKVVLLFEFPENRIEVDGVSKPMMTSHFLNAYLGSEVKPSKTNLFLSAWRGRAFTDVELGGFDLSKVVGAPCLLNIIHTTRNGKTREEIASIMPLPKTMKAAPPFNRLVVYEIEQLRDDTFLALPEWMRLMIEGCEEWTAPKPAQSAVSPHQPESDDVPF